jgi:hypothetical protein
MEDQHLYKDAMTKKISPLPPFLLLSLFLFHSSLHMSDLHLPGMRYNHPTNNDVPLLDQQQDQAAVHSMMEKDVMRLLPPTWKASKENGNSANNGLGSGFYPGADFGQASFDGFRVRPHMHPFQQQQADHLQQSQINHHHHHHHPFTTPPSTNHFSSPMFYNTNDASNNTMYYQQQQQQQQQLPPPPTQQNNQREAILTEVLKPRPMRKRRRPPHSYASLIAQAILTSQEQKMTLREIYEWVQTRYPHLYEANETGWQVRHKCGV